MTSITEIVNSSMHNEGSSEDGVLSEQGNLLVLDLVVGDAIVSSSHVTEVTNVSHLSSWATVSLSVWVEMWSGGLASFGEVSKLMDVEAMLSWGQSLNGC